jgi:predicted RNA-binding Zn ribbon-like protein
MNAHSPDHHHVADLEATLDFLNSEALDDGVPVDRLHTADDAVAFLAGRGMGHEEALRAQARSIGEAAWLDRVRMTRTALRRVWDAQVEHHEPDRASLDTVNAVLREAPRIELVAGDGCCGIGHRHTADDPLGEAMARLVEPFVAAIAAGGTDRFRICANDGCRWVFEDTSRAGRRRWCDMTSCGNVAKARRYRARHRAATVELVELVVLEPAGPGATGPAGNP